MNKSRIESFATAFIHSDANRIPKDVAREAALAGTQIFSEPLFAYGKADDEGLIHLQNRPEAHVPLMPPREWLPGAQSVISCFLPFTEPIRASNRKGPDVSWGWLHARIEGQAALQLLAQQLCAFIQEAGYQALAPALDERFKQTRGTQPGETPFTSNWSERHVGFYCGLGTFSLSKGLITKKGVAGRIFSIVTSLELEPTKRAYAGLLDYCTLCGACRANCPVGAISEPHRKDDALCITKLNEPLQTDAPYYGCGKCQTAVPCEHKIPVTLSAPNPPRSAPL
jgi:epoxyqueuosine reductase QueG